MSQAVVTRWGLQGGQSFKQPQLFSPTLPLFTSSLHFLSCSHRFYFAQSQLLKLFNLTVWRRMPFLICLKSACLISSKFNGSFWSQLKTSEFLTQGQSSNRTNSLLFVLLPPSTPLSLNLSFDCQHTFTVKKMHRPTLPSKFLSSSPSFILGNRYKGTRNSLDSFSFHDGWDPLWRL